MAFISQGVTSLRMIVISLSVCVCVLSLCLHTSSASSLFSPSPHCGGYMCGMPKKIETLIVPRLRSLVVEKAYGAKVSVAITK